MRGGRLLSCKRPLLLLPPRARKSGRAAPPSKREARGHLAPTRRQGQPMEILVQGTSPERTERMV